MKNIVLVSIFLISLPTFAMTSKQSTTRYRPTSDEPTNATGDALIYPLENNWSKDPRQDLQEEVDPCYDLSGKLLPGCSEKMLRNKTKRPRRSNGEPKDRMNSRGFRENNTTQTEQ